MKKRLFLLLVLAFMMGTVCHAQIIPSQGPGQIGLQSVVLCESLSLHQDPDYSSPSTQTLKNGDRIIVMDQSNGWAHCVLGDSEDSPSGWVRADFLAVDPAWYRTETDTPVYAWNDTTAPKVALLDPNTALPILKDDGNWLVVSLRGAAGWISNPSRGTGTAANSSTAQNNSTGSGSGSAQNSGSSQSEDSGSQGWFTVYARDGSTAYIHPTGGAMYEDDRGRTYVKQEDDGYYYCITTDITYAFDPTMWTGEAYGENEFPNDVDYDDNSDQESADYSFTVTADDGSTAYIHQTDGAMYEDAGGRSYVYKDGGYYCIEEDKMYY